MNTISPALTLSLETSPEPDDVRIVAEGLERAVQEQLGAEPVLRFSVFLRSPSGEVLGGINARIAFGNLHIDQVWCDEAVRRRGYGSALLERAEDWAQQYSAGASLLNTVDPERVEFYQRRGYRNIGEIPGLLGGKLVFFMRKQLGLATAGR